jgi:hypothetical protein
MKIPGNDLCCIEATGTASRAGQAPRLAAPAGSLIIAGLREQRRRTHGAVVAGWRQLYRDQILRALFAVMALALLSGCKSSPPPVSHNVSGLENAKGYSVIVIPVFIMRQPSSQDNDNTDTPPWYNQTDPGTVPFKVPDHGMHAEEASALSRPQSGQSTNAAGDSSMVDLNKPKAGFAGVPSAGAEAHSSTER